MEIFSKRFFSLTLLGILGLSVACTKNIEATDFVQTQNLTFPSTPTSTPTSTETFLNYPEVNLTISSAWLPLRNRLAADGIKGAQVDLFLAQLEPELSQDPMGRKVKELYTNKFIKRPPSTVKPNYDYPPEGSKVPGPWYKNTVTTANAKLCLEFMEQYKPAFTQAQKTYGIPPEVAAALLFIETRLGNYLGKDNAFYTLASMASTSDVREIPVWIEKLPADALNQKDWINQKIEEKSNWAYKEFRAFMTHILENDLDPHAMPSSVYGAIGLCQFMPSNLKPYSADGDNDGVIDLFNPNDAIMSLASYLNKHGWSNSSFEQKHKTLKKYNNLNIYANTILALAEKINSTMKTKS